MLNYVLILIDSKKKTTLSSHLQSCFNCRCIGYALAALVHSGSKCIASQLQDLMLSVFEQLLMSKIATQRLVAGLVLSLWANFDQVRTCLLNIGTCMYIYW